MATRTSEAGQDSKKQNQTFRDFAGVNTQASRQSINKNEFAWLENVQPIGHGVAKVVLGPSTALASVVGTTCYFMQAANISNVDYMFMFCADGSAYQVNLSNNVKTTVGAAGTFNGSGTTIAQWKNERILIIDPTKGYFSWDTSTLLTINSGVAYVTVTTYGSGYTSRPLVTFGGPGSSAAATAIVGLGNAVLSAAGSGYFVNDVLTVSGGTFNTAAQLTVTAVNGSGAITGFGIRVPGDYTATPGASPVTVTGGFGSSATFTPTWSVVTVNVTSSGSGYTSAPSVSFGGPGSGAAATAYVSVAPSSGTSIATYGGRVWIASGRTISFSAPTSYIDFSSTNAGGSFVVTDETLHSNINQLVTANNFLYFYGDTSINVISDLRVANGITVFSNTNVSASVGSTYAGSIIPYYRSVWFANRYGIYSLYGSTTQKASGPLDGFYQNLVLNNAISAGQFILNDILCVGFLTTYNDPVLGNRQVIAVFMDKKWFFASQGAMTYIAESDVGGVPTLYGTDGTSLYKLFSDSSVNVSHKIQSALWDMGDPLRTKQALKFGLELNSSAVVSSISIAVDTESASQTYSTVSGNSIVWKNNAGATISWTNNSSTAITWIATGYVFSRQDVSNYGNYLGFTITSSAPALSYSGMHYQYELRTPWTGVPF